LGALPTDKKDKINKVYSSQKWWKKKSLKREVFGVVFFFLMDRVNIIK
jgi:hypothetical protein